MTTLHALNQADPEQFLMLIGGPLEGERWLAERVLSQRPFASVEALSAAFEQAAQIASTDEKIQLIRSHPDLADKVALRPLSVMSQQEQAAAGLDRLTADEYAAFHRLNTLYKETFGFPFVICARENTKDSILAAFATRLHHTRADEIELALTEVLKILRLRLMALVVA